MTTKINISLRKRGTLKSNSKMHSTGAANKISNYVVSSKKLPLGLEKKSEKYLLIWMTSSATRTGSNF